MDSLKVLSVVTDDGTAVSSCWQHFVDMDLDELRLGRDRMKMALARYGRQSLWCWDDKPVTELVHWYRLLCDLVEGENEVQRITED